MNPRRILALILAAAFLLAGWGPPPAAPVASGSPASPADDWYPLPAPTAPGGTVLDLAASPAQPGLLFALILDPADAYPYKNYYATHSRLYRSLDAAETWEQMFIFDYPVYMIAPDSASPQTLYLGSENGLLRSEDGGLTWTPFYPLGQVVAAPASGLFYAGGIISDETYSECPQEVAVVARSTDGGVTWQQTTLGCAGRLLTILVEPGDPQVVYAGGYSIGAPDTLLWRSLDGGETWAQIVPANGFGEERHSIYLSLVVDPVNPARLFFYDMDGPLASNDRGETWQIPPFPPAEKGSYRLAAIGDRLYAAPYYGTDIPVYYSDNWGQTWWQSVAHLPAGAACLLPDPHTLGRIYAGLQDYGVWRSDLRGSAWVEVNRNIRSTVSVRALTVDPSDPAHWLAGAVEYRPGLFETYDSGLSWTEVITDVQIQSVGIHPTTPTIAFAGSPATNYFRQPTGEWGEFGYHFEIADVSFSAHPQPWTLLGGWYSFNDTNGEGEVEIYRPTASGWYWLTSRVPDSDPIAAVASDPRNPDVLFAAEGDPGMFFPDAGLGRIWRSLDGGETWEAVYTMKGTNVVDLLIDPYRPDTIYAADSPHVVISQDGGNTWGVAWQGLPFGGRPITALAMDEWGELYASTQRQGIYRWVDEWGFWTPEGLDEEKLWTLQYVPGPHPALIAGGDRLWRRDLPPVHRVYYPLIFE